MSYLGQKVFTDAIKDVIGNEPVLDQYDTAYDASFYGTMQDDFITGTMLSRITGQIGTAKFVLLTTGSSPRGSVFSKYYAESQPRTESTYGTNAVKQNPSLAFRQIPWEEKVSHTAYRIAQAFDSDERYFDSCLPDVARCFGVNDSSPWTTTAEMSKGWLSPYANVVTGNIAYMYFNTYKVGQLVNNDWTWSYPYENKYSPEIRKTKVNPSLIETVRIKVEGVAGITTNVSVVEENKPIVVKGFLPLLAGKNDAINLDSNARNSFRSVYSVSGSYGTITAIPAAYSGSQFDDIYGYCYTIPSDVDLNRLVSHADYLSVNPNVTVPDPEYSTGSMSSDDMVRFLFGFGDINNMTYGRRLFLPNAASSSHSDRFESAGINANALGLTRDRADLLVNWSNSPTTKKWRTRTRTGTYSDTVNYFGGGITQNYHYLTGSSGGGKGLYWLSSSAPSNVGILASDTNTAYGGDLTDPALPSFDVSACCVDVTSSYPWHLRYKRGVACHQTDGLVVYFAGIPGIPSHEYDPIFGGYGVVTPIEVVTGSGTGATGGASAQSAGLITQYDSRVEGLGDNPIIGINAPAWQYPFEPGAYRIVFAYTISGGSGTIGDPSIAAIDDFQILQLKEDAFPPDVTGQKIGCNNYPKFRTYRCDNRFNPLASGYPAQVTGSSNVYRGYNFGISPIIRGWKYGLYSGFPTYSKVVYRRNRFGQFRDMLEQRQDTKYIDLTNSPFDDDAITYNDYSKADAGYSLKKGGVKNLKSSPVEVDFVKQVYKVDEKGIGTIYVEPITASGTISMNLSTEVTSSQPYFDGEIRLRESKNGVSYGMNVKVTTFP